MFHSLKAKVRLLILLPLLTLGGVAIVTYSSFSSRQLVERTKDDAARTTDSLSGFIRESGVHLALETKLLAMVPYIRSAAETNDPKTLQPQIDIYAPFLNRDGLAILGDEHNMLAQTGKFEDFAALKSQINAAYDNKSGFYFARTKEGLLLVATAPIMAGQSPWGVALCYSQIDNQAASGLARQLSTEMAFVDKGKIVASSWGQKPIFHKAPNSLIYADIDGEEYVGQYAPISDAPSGVGVVSFRSVAEILGPSRVFLASFLIVLLLAFAITAALADRFARGMIRPLEQIAGAAKSMESGRWPEPTKVSRRDEIGELQSSFNQMIKAVRDHEQRLLAMIDLDPLTELPNHRRFKEAVGEKLAANPCGSIVLMGLDRFSDYNQAQGYEKGDQALRSLAACLISECAEGAVVARYGGDTFAAFLPNSPLSECQRIAESIREAFLPCELSAGCAEVGPSTDRAPSLCLAAELALAQAKQLGRNQVCDFSAIATGKGADPFELNKFLLDGTIATVQALAAAVDAKDSYTKGHSQRVAEYAAELCRYIGGTDQDVELIFRTGTLHDVGKIGVPDGVLNKPGPLTPEERAIMETHPALGEVIVKKVPQLQDTLSGVRHHHERWDGKGYPDALAGENIPFLGRILAVADTYDAMTSDRPYRKGMPIGVALAEIEKNAGIQFDPALAKAFVEMMSTQIKQLAA